jgi:hypothetical protein
MDSERIPLFRGRKCSFRGIPSSAEELILKLGTEQNGTESRKKIKFYGTCTASMNKSGSNRRPHPCTGCLITITLRKHAKYLSNDFSVPQKSLFWHYFWNFGSEQVSLPRNGSERNSDSLLLYLFHGTEFRDIFSSAEGFGREFWEYASIFVSSERNSELFSLPRKGSERNSEVFCSAEQPEFRRK